MIKSIIFDVGGTYMAGDMDNFVNRSYRILGIEKTYSTDEKIVFDLDLNRGIISHEECFRKFFAVPISEAQMESIKQIWATTWAPTEEMVVLVKNLQKKYILAILSNSDSYNSGKYMERGWYSYFTHLILSHEAGILKPERRIYEITLEKIKLPAEECLFIDDQEKVLAPAREMGMDTIHFKTFNQLENELKARGLID